MNETRDEGLSRTVRHIELLRAVDEAPEGQKGPALDALEAFHREWEEERQASTQSEE